MFAELIVYACPTGPLAANLADYFGLSKELYGANAAHRYMPHITLTGFFHDQHHQIDFYQNALAAAHHQSMQQIPTNPCQISQLIISDSFHGLLIESIWLQQLTADFAERAANAPTRQDSIRLKNWLHLSLAYEFKAEQAQKLAELAQKTVDLHLPVGWDLCLYERQAGDTWILHASWELLAP